MGLEIKNKGFTLIELLVALTAFSLVMVSLSSIAVSMIKSQRKAFIVQEVEESSRYILEMMIKEIRMSRINSADSSGALVDTLSLTNGQGDDIIYEFDDNKFYRYPAGQSAGLNYLLSNQNNFAVSGGFSIAKNASPNWAVVTIVMKFDSLKTRAEEQTEINLQNTVCSRSFTN